MTFSEIKEKVKDTAMNLYKILLQIYINLLQCIINIIYTGKLSNVCPNIEGA